MTASVRAVRFSHIPRQNTENFRVHLCRTWYSDLPARHIRPSLKRTTRNERTTGPALRHEIGLTLFGVSVERPSKWRKPIIYVTFALQIGRPSHTHNGHRCLGGGGAILSSCLPPEIRHAQTYGWWHVYEEKEGKVGCSISRRLRSLHYKRN
jgi:hypothetical protein